MKSQKSSKGAPRLPTCEGLAIGSFEYSNWVSLKAKNRQAEDRTPLLFFLFSAIWAAICRMKVVLGAGYVDRLCITSPSVRLVAMSALPSDFLV